MLFNIIVSKTWQKYFNSFVYQFSIILEIVLRVSHVTHVGSLHLVKQKSQTIKQLSKISLLYWTVFDCIIIKSQYIALTTVFSHNNRLIVQILTFSIDLLNIEMLVVWVHFHVSYSTFNNIVMHIWKGKTICNKMSMFNSKCHCYF